MYKSRTFFRGLLVVGVAVMLCGYVLAAEQATQRDQSRTTPQAQQSQQQGRQTMQQAAGAQMSGMLHRTDKLIGAKVKDAQGADLGKIYDLVLTPDNQQISYAALSSGGTLGIGAKYFAIPWSAIRADPQGNVVVPISKSQLDQASGFNRANWPAQPDWQLISSMMREGRTSGQQSRTETQPQSADTTRDRSASETRQTTRPGQAGAGMTASDIATSRDVQFRRVTHLTGMKVMNPDGEDIGNIEGFVIDARQGQVAYTIVSFGGLWGIGEKYAAVPAGAVDLQPRRQMARLDADRATLEKVAFDPDEFPDLSNRQYAQNLHEMFHAEPYWNVMGFVSPEQAMAANQRAWGSEGQFAKEFDASKVKTLEGTVQSVGMFQPEGAAPGTIGGLRIRLMTEDGKLVTVYGGPVLYAESQDFHVMPGDKISVTGSETKIGWRDVFVASQMKADSRTLQLRSETGQPAWTSPQSTERQRTQTQQPGSTGQSQRQRQPENQ